MAEKIQNYNILKINATNSIIFFYVTRVTLHSNSVKT